MSLHSADPSPIPVAAIVASLGLLLAPALAAQDAPVPYDPPSVELPAELDRVLRDYERAWAAGDPQGLARLFTDDGLVPGDSGWRLGAEEIASEYAGAGGPLRLRAVSYALDGGAGFIAGAYGYGSTPAPDRGMFVLALRRATDGRWLIQADLDRGIPPAPGGDGSNAPGRWGHGHDPDTRRHP